MWFVCFVVLNGFSKENDLLDFTCFPMRSLPSLVVIGCLTAGTLRAQDPPVLTMETTAGKRTGALQEFDLAGGVRLSGEAQPLAVDRNLLQLRNPSIKAAEGRRPPVLLLTDGGRIPLAADGPIRLAEDILQVRPAGSLRSGPGRDLGIPTFLVAALVLGPAEPGQDEELFRARLLRRRRANDLVVLRGGDRLEGRLLETKEGEAVVGLGERKETVPLARVAALLWNSETQVVPRFRRPHAWVVLRDGSRLTFETLRLDGERFTGRPVFGGKLSFPAADLVELEIRGGAAVHLSDLKEQRFEHTPFLGIKRPLGKDEAPDGKVLRLGGTSPDKGLAMPVRSRVTYALDGSFRRFDGLLGLQDAPGNLGRARVVVRVDGKERDLGFDGIVAGGDPPRTVSLDLTGAKTLELEADFAGRGSVQGLVVWGEARLIR